MGAVQEVRMGNEVFPQDTVWEAIAGQIAQFMATHSEYSIDGGILSPSYRNGHEETDDERTLWSRVVVTGNGTNKAVSVTRSISGCDEPDGSITWDNTSLSYHLAQTEGVETDAKLTDLFNRLQEILTPTPQEG